MGRINVEGLGVVEIAGDEPTREELNIIKNNYQKIVSEEATSQQANKATDDFITGPGFGRLLAEVGLGIVGSIATGGLAAPALAIRAGFLARPFLLKLAQSSAGSAVGSGTGAGISQIFDPKESVIREIGRASLEGAIAEGVGTPAVAGISKFVVSPLASKFFAKGPKQFVDELEGAVSAEKAIAEESKRILEDPKKYAKLIPGKSDAGELTDKNIETIKLIANQAKDANLTLAGKTDSRALDILELISEKSLIGGGTVVGKKEVNTKIADAALFRFQDNVTQGLKNEEVGQFYLNTLANSDKAFRTTASGFYKAIDAELIKSGVAEGKIIPTISLKNIIQKQKDYLGGRSGPVNKALTDVEAFGDRASFGQASAFIRTLNDDIGTAFAGAKRNEAKALLNIKEDITKLLDDETLVPASVRGAQIAANRFYNQGAKIFNEGLFEKLLTKGDPDTVFQSIIQGGLRPATVEKTFNQIDQLTKIGQKEINNIGELVPKLGANNKPITILDKTEAEALKNRLRGQFLVKLTDASKSSTPVYGEFFNAKKFSDQLDKFKDTSEKLFTKEQVSSLKNINNMMNFAQDTIQRRGGLPGGMFIQLKQAGAATQVGVATLQFGGAGFAGFSSEDVLPAVTILLGPAAIGKMLTSKSISNFLFKEYSKENFGKISTTKAGVLYRQLLGRMADEGVINSEELAKYTKETKEVEDALIKRGIRKSTDLSSSKVFESQTTPQQRPTPTMPPVNTRVTNVQTRPMAAPMQGTMPTGGLQERIAQSNQLDQFIPVR